MLASIVTTIQSPTAASRELAERTGRVGGKLYIAGDSKGPEAYDTLDFKPSTELKKQMNGGSSRTAKAKAKTKAKTKTKTKVKTKAKTGRGKKSARSSRKSSKTKTKTKSRTRAKAKRAAAGPGGRKLVTREEVDLELPGDDSLLPDAPLQKVGGRRRSTGDGTGTQGAK